MKQKFLTSLEYVQFPLLGEQLSIINFTNLIDITPVLDKFKNDVLTYIVKDDEKIEGISYNLYKTTDYYDMLMILNGMKRMTELPVNIDVVYKKIQEEYNYWLLNIGENKTDKQKQEKMLQIEQIVKDENEKYRHLKYLKPQIISSFEVEFKNYINDMKK